MRILSLFILLLLAGCSSQPQLTGSGWSVESNLISDYYHQWRGTPYRLGGDGRAGLDCSAFVQNLYQTVYGFSLERTTEAQAEQGYQVLPGELLPGDLIFFNTGWRTRHVGVYLGNNEFVHASTSVGVTRSRVNSEYWQDLFWQARRIF